MKTKIILFVILVFSFNSLIGQSRLESKKLKEEKSQKEYLQIKEIVEFKTYLFEISRVMPMGGSSINVSGDGYYIKITMDSIYTSLPYFGRMYTSSGYGNNGGISFDGYIDNYGVESDDTSKKVTLKITSKKDNERIEFVINVHKSGHSSIIVRSMERSTISFTGKLIQTQDIVL